MNKFHGHGNRELRCARTKFFRNRSANFSWQAQACTSALCDIGFFKVYAAKNLRWENRVPRIIKRLNQAGKQKIKEWGKEKLERIPSGWRKVQFDGGKNLGRKVKLIGAWKKIPYAVSWTSLLP